MKKPTQFAIRRAKATLAGRMLCRLLGEETGAVLMEYVVLGVLLVAAVVGAVVMFGDNIGGAFKVMSKALFSPGKAKEQHQTEMDQFETREGNADDTATALTDGAHAGATAE